MRQLSALLVALFLFAAPAALNSAHAADSKKGAPKDSGAIEGKVSTEKDGDKYKSVKIKTDKGDIYNVTLDDNGNKVGKDYDLIRVYVKGKVETKGGEKWVTVTQIGEGTKRKK